MKVSIKIFTVTKIASILLWLVVVLMTNSTSANSTDEEYEKRLNELQKSISELQQQLTKVEGDRSDLQELLKKSEVDIGKLTKKINTLEEALAREKKQLNQLQTERSQLELSRDYQQKQIIDIINRSYRLGRQSHIKLLLNQQQPTLISRLLRYHEYLIQARAAKINDYRETMARLSQLESKIIESSNILENRRQTLNRRYQQLRDSQAKRIKVLKKLNADFKTKNSRLIELEQDRQRLQMLLDEATNSLANLKLPDDALLFKQLRGELPKPSTGKVLHHYGSYRSSSRLTWNGIFYGDRPGSDVTAIHYGRVIFSDYLKGHGLLLIIDHGDGYMSLYAHNQALYKETGDWVRGEEVIASVGNSGGLESAGLYFEIRHQGQPQDPEKWLKP